VHLAARGRTVALVLITVIPAACSSNSPNDSKARAEGVYESVVRWFAQRSSTDPDPLPVFIEPRGEGTSINLDVQAQVVQATHDVATVRFIDSRDEALVTKDDGTVVVANDGVLLRLDPVADKGNPIRLDVDVHDQDDTFTTMEFDLQKSHDVWSITKQPTEVPGG
jgi:hypothetical protein